MTRKSRNSSMPQASAFFEDILTWISWANFSDRSPRPGFNARPPGWFWGKLLVWVIVFSTGAGPVLGATLLLKDGRSVEGKFTKISGVADDPFRVEGPDGEMVVTPILVIDDGLRRTFVHNTQVRQVLEQVSEKKVRINIWQDVAERGGGIGRVGSRVRVTPFDEYGRRIYEMRSRDGVLSIVQGITQITPVYTKVQGLMGAPRPIAWDSRIATSSIPREVLSRILATSVPREDIEARLQVVKLYLQSERYRDARLELEQIVEDFPERSDLQQDIRQLRQLGARLLLKEIRLRDKAGQHKFVQTLLAQFPSEGVAGETLQEVREFLAKQETMETQQTEQLAQLQQQIAQLTSANGKALAEQFAKEVAENLNSDTLGRLAPFHQLSKEAGLTPEQKVAVAISGWLVGSSSATDNFQVALSLVQVRDQVQQFLREPLTQERSRMLTELRDLEGATVKRVAQLLQRIQPPIEVPAEAKQGPGFYEITLSGTQGAGDVRYLVQLPPEYHPLRRYPLIVTLGGFGYPPAQQLDYWAGSPNKDESDPQKIGPRNGQAMRRGYITLAVDWQAPHQAAYEYSSREHQAVLRSLRDACRRFSVDTDRVFLTGHGMGGDAIWDIGLAHPDLWAGVLPIVAKAGRYCSRYWNHAQYVSWYVVAGELDGDKMAKNARELDRYLRPKFDTTVVEYLGRGFEPFPDEIQRLFDWMGRRRRQLFPREFECASMRPWDNFFWWLEVDGLPTKSMVSPDTWPPPRGARPARLRGKIAANNNKVQAFVRAGRTTVWLAPEFVNFEKPLTVELNGRKISSGERFITPDLGVLLEDARTRADRQHPFWAKVVGSRP